MPIYEPKREEDVFRNVTAHNQGPLTSDAVKSIFERIIDEMRSLQRMRRRKEKTGRERMLVVMQQGASDLEIQAVIDRLVSMGFTVHRSTGVMHTVLGGVGPVDDFDPADFEAMEGVKECHRIVSPYKLASRHFKPQGTVVKIRQGRNRRAARGHHGRTVQRGEPANRSKRVAGHRGRRQGAQVMRGGAFKPRSSPYSFQGMGEEGLKMMRAAADRHGLLVVSEVMDHIADSAADAVFRHSANRRAQHAELQSAARSRQDAQAGAAEARHRGDHRRTCCWPPSTS